MRRSALIKSFLLFALCGIFHVAVAQHSVARQWNEALLEGIRHDYARPTVHARNLFHISTVMYDAWAAYDSVARPFMLGDTVWGFYCPFAGVSPPADVKAAREEAISYAAYRMLKHRFRNAPGAAYSMHLFDSLFVMLGYDSNYTSTNYASDTPAALGNYIAQKMIAFGHQDGANEQNGYANRYYQPENPPLVPVLPGNPDIVDPNHWQPLTLDVFIDQSGNVIPLNTPDFVSPEWGDVVPFSLRESERKEYIRDGNTYWVYDDPGMPPHIQPDGGGWSDEYKWSFSLVAIWSSHLAPTDSVMWDISPASIGNIQIQDFPTRVEDYPNFYDRLEGGDIGTGYSVNPKTGQPYTPQVVPRGDYARILAEFWADGPNSETPPGHWFTILNYVNDHPLFTKRWRGTGPVLDDLEWDVKAYFALGGAVHDAAVSSWGIKGWYDYVRPISAIRYMADQGQCTDTTLSNYSPEGIPLVPGKIEVVEAGDSLAGASNQNVGKIKLYAWRGPDYINDPDTDEAGVGWILADNWWPYQRPYFVTPPFAGYVSGHSTYSRAAAELMTLLTGDEYFPGGMGEFEAPKNQFLVFEDGPSMDVTLQWAKYRDASDQCSLSRIWGGIHPPADDIPGRFIGMEIGVDAFAFAETYMGYPDLRGPRVIAVTPSTDIIATADTGTVAFTLSLVFDEKMDTSLIPVISFPMEDPLANTLTFNASASSWVSTTEYIAGYDVVDASEVLRDIDIQVTGGADVEGNAQFQLDDENVFSIDMQYPVTVAVTPDKAIVADADIGTASFTLTITFNEKMDTTVKPVLAFPVEDPLSKTLSFNPINSHWIQANTFEAKYDVADSNETLSDIDIHVEGCKDEGGNIQTQYDVADIFSIDMKNPSLSVSPSVNTINDGNAGPAGFSLSLAFDEAMDTVFNPQVTFPVEDPLSKTLTFDTVTSGWVSTSTYQAVYNVADSSETLVNIDVTISGARDKIGNDQEMFNGPDNFSIDTENPAVVSVIPSQNQVTGNDAGSATFALVVSFNEAMDTISDPVLSFPVEDPSSTLILNTGSSAWIGPTTYEARYDVTNTNDTLSNIDVTVAGGMDEAGNIQEQQFGMPDLFDIETDAPGIEMLTTNLTLITDTDIATGAFTITMRFDEFMDTTVYPAISFPTEDPSSTLILNSSLSGWTSLETYEARYDISDANESVSDIDVSIMHGVDLAGNEQEQFNETDQFSIDTKNPHVTGVTATPTLITNSNTGTASFVLTIDFDENMDVSVDPAVVFPIEYPACLSMNTSASQWTGSTTYMVKYDVASITETLSDIDVQLSGARDEAGNRQVQYIAQDNFSVDIKDSVGTGIGNFSNHASVIIYPNPVGRGYRLQVELKGLETDAMLHIYNMQGASVLSKDIKGQQHLTLETDEMASGIYLFSIVGHDTYWSERIIIN